MVFKKFIIFLEMIKFEHTIFALPFAYIGAILAASGIPSSHDLFWITMAMVGARTAAMSLNRIIDRSLDARNPRTANRAIPRGLLSVKEVLIYIVLSFSLLFVSAYQLSPLAFKLFPVAVVVLVVYSYTKRFSWLCHLFLGVALGLGPLGAWIAIANQVELAPVLLAIAVLFWVAGFDIIYACEDFDFDRTECLFSIPACFGLKKALIISSIFHVISLIFFVLTGLSLQLWLFYYLGVAIAAAILWYEHTIISPVNLSKAGMAFFNLNGALSIAMISFTFLDIIL